jgi:hypothetical protein
MFIRLRLFLIIICAAIHCFGQNPGAKTININPKARALNDSAVSLVMDNFHYDKAIDLLNQALQIDSSYLTAKACFFL